MTRWTYMGLTDRGVDVLYTSEQGFTPLFSLVPIPRGKAEKGRHGKGERG